MTTNEAQKLTDDELRVKIAELCGWGDIHPWGPDRNPVGTPPGYRIPATLEERACSTMLPNYTSDLNAMHEAEKQLFSAVTDGECRYRDALIEITRSRISHPLMQMDLVVTTARQRAEAFVLAFKVMDHCLA